MQIGLDKKKPILACNARKDRDYLCPECHQPIRIRHGNRRRKHFFHINPHVSCKQGKKDAHHICVQRQLLYQLVDVTLEKPFPKINRIADVVWEEKKLIFEVQCSPISISEVKARNRDYGSVGYEVIWILHDKRYNRRYLTPAENFLRSGTALYTNIRTEVSGVIYDQDEYVSAYYRSSRGHRLVVDPRNPVRRGVTRRPKKIPSLPVLAKKGWDTFVKYMVLRDR